MAYGNHVTVTGNVTRDPELRFLESGVAMARLGVAWNLKGKDGKDDKPMYFDVTCWGQLAENVSDSIVKGTRVTIEGRLDFQAWETDDGQKRSKVTITADEVSASLRWASAEISKNERSGGFRDGAPDPEPPAGVKAPAAAPAYDVNEEPF